LQLSLHL